MPLQLQNSPFHSAREYIVLTLQLTTLLFVLSNEGTKRARIPVPCQAVPLAAVRHRVGFLGHV